jgi:hypothetical protein
MVFRSPGAVKLVDDGDGLFLARAAPTGLPDPLCPSLVGLEVGHLAEATGQALQEFLVVRLPGWGQRVIAPQAGFAHGYQAYFAQKGQVS